MHLKMSNLFLMTRENGKFTVVKLIFVAKSLKKAWIGIKLDILENRIQRLLGPKISKWKQEKNYSVFLVWFVWSRQSRIKITSNLNFIVKIRSERFDVIFVMNVKEKKNELNKVQDIPS